MVINVRDHLNHFIQKLYEFQNDLMLLYDFINPNINHILSLVFLQKDSISQIEILDSSHNYNKVKINFPLIQEPIINPRQSWNLHIF